MKHAACLEDIPRAITDVVVDRRSDTTPLPRTWEAFMCVLRGILTSHGAHLKSIPSDLVSTLLHTVASPALACGRFLLG